MEFRKPEWSRKYRNKNLIPMFTDNMKLLTFGGGGWTGFYYVALTVLGPTM